MPESALFWFRNDLRTHDQAVLNRLISSCASLHTTYIFNRSTYASTPWGFSRTGAFRHAFLLESLGDLKDALASKGLGLHIRYENAADALLDLCKTYQIKKVYAQELPGWEEQKMEKIVEEVLLKEGIELMLHSNHTLIDPLELPFTLPRLPEIFTEFRKKVERESRILEDAGELSTFKGSSKSSGTFKCDFWPEKKVEIDKRTVIRFVGGEQAGLTRLQEYIWKGDHLKNYKETRNGLLGADYSSKLSPWLALGCISPRRIYAEIKRYEQTRISNASTYWLYFELLWRDYFQFVALKHGPHLYRSGGIKQQMQKWMFDAEKFERWRQGQTGQPFIDANMRELLLTGWMSNRGRQNVASYLVHQLKLDWRAGAAWFESQLIDYDPASNYGNWNYLAGIGNDPRENRIFNPIKQAENYDPKGEYVRLWLS
jgi:deoxyribodipyrimidine photo-lyase